MNCDMKDQQFEDRNQWYEHELQNHRVEWCCNVEGHSPCATRSEFLQHMQEHHAGLQLLSLPQDMIQQFRRPIQKSQKVCPLCSKPAEKFKSHVSRHMEQMALYVLGGNNQEDDSDAGSDASHQAKKVDSTDSEISDEDSIAGGSDPEHPSSANTTAPDDPELDEESKISDATEDPWTLPFNVAGALSLTIKMAVFLNFSSQLIPLQIRYRGGSPPTLNQDKEHDWRIKSDAMLSILVSEIAHRNKLGSTTEIERCLGLMCYQSQHLCKDLQLLMEHSYVINRKGPRQELEERKIRKVSLQRELAVKVRDMRYQLETNVLLPFR